MNDGKKTVFVGLSGGVDSSVSAYRLLRAGYNVIGVFIKTWHPDFLVCNWEAERLDAMRVAAHLGIPFRTFDAEAAYKHEVAEYMISEYKAGRTPNPDVMCNQHVKFGVFLKYALSEGADAVATGHYAQIAQTNERNILKRGIDKSKDQSYFLWTLSQEQLGKILFPVGDTKKIAVREEAAHAQIPVYAKRDSQGVCFLGDIDMKDFLSHYITLARGDVLNEAGERIGEHDGALFYTIGQRHGFTIAIQNIASVPHYVISKDIDQNTITVSTEQQSSTGKFITLKNINRITEKLPTTCEAQFRYRQKPFHITILIDTESELRLRVDDTDVELPSLGQSCVFYDGDTCLGGGIIAHISDS